MKARTNYMIYLKVQGINASTILLPVASVIISEFAQIRYSSCVFKCIDCHGIFSMIRYINTTFDVRSGMHGY